MSAETVPKPFFLPFLVVCITSTYITIYTGIQWPVNLHELSQKLTQVSPKEVYIEDNNTLQEKIHVERYLLVVYPLHIKED